MAISKCLFNTQTLSIFNMIDPDESIHYNWYIDQDYSIVGLVGSININGTIVNSVNEYRVQPNTYLDVTGLGSSRSYFISLFRIDDDSVANQILTEANKTRTRTFAPSWHDIGVPINPDTSWESKFTSGHYILSKDEINNQVAASDWN